MSERLTIQIYDPPTGAEDGWRDLKRGDVNDAISWEYDKHFAGVGTFALELPITSPYAAMIGDNSVLYIYRDSSTRSGEGFIVRNIVQSEDTYKVTGYDLNGLLRDRLIVPPTEGSVEGEDGASFAVVTGSTETCVKQYVTDNCISPEDVNRTIPRLSVAEDKGRGLAEDSNMIRLESVEDVVRRMCLAQKLGYRVSMQYDAQLNTQPLWVFDVMEQTDRSANQKDRNRAVFSVGHRNITSLTYEHGITSDRSTLYADNQSDATVVVHKDVDKPAAGLDRREEYVALQCDVDEVDKYAAREFADRFPATSAMEVEAGNPLDYGVLYDVGDIVTVYDNDRKLQLDSVIASITTRWTASEYAVKLTLGESKPKLLDNYQKKNSSIQRTQVNNQPTIIQGGGGSSAYTTGIDFNDAGFDLHFKTSASGAVQTNTYEWTLDNKGRITLLHNATINRDIVITYDGTADDTNKDIVTSAWFDYTTYSSGTWTSKVNEESYTCSIESGTPVVGADYVQLSADCYASFGVAHKPWVLWCVVNTMTTVTSWTPLLAARLTNRNLCTGMGQDIYLSDGNKFAASQIGQDAVSGISGNTGWHAVLIAANTDWSSAGTPYRIYIDGVLSGTCATINGTLSDEAYNGTIKFDSRYYVNRCVRGTDVTAGTTARYKAFGFNAESLTHDQCLTMCKALYEQYVGGDT